MAITVQLANSIQALIAQKLLPKAGGQGRVLACEICIATHAVRIIFATHQSASVVQAKCKNRAGGITCKRWIKNY